MEVGVKSKEKREFGIDLKPPTVLEDNPMTPVIAQTELKTLTLKGRGKVRDIYDLGDRLLIVATDRISAFDVVMPDPIPDKGIVLTQLSKFWFELTKDLIQNHVISTRVEDFPQGSKPYRRCCRTALCSSLKPIPSRSNVW